MEHILLGIQEHTEVMKLSTVVYKITELALSKSKSLCYRHPSYQCDEANLCNAALLTQIRMVTQIWFHSDYQVTSNSGLVWYRPTVVRHLRLPTFGHCVAHFHEQCGENSASRHKYLLGTSKHLEIFAFGSECMAITRS